MFRPTGYLPKPRDLFARDQAPRFYTEGEELEQFIRRIPSLKTRHCYFWDKESPFGAQSLVANRVPDPHEFAGLPEEQFLRFIEELEPLWKRMGRKREESKSIIAARRKQWGIESNASQPPQHAQNRKALLTKLEAPAILILKLVFQWAMRKTVGSPLAA